MPKVEVYPMIAGSRLRGRIAAGVMVACEAMALVMRDAEMKRRSFKASVTMLEYLKYIGRGITISCFKGGKFNLRSTTQE